MQKISTQERRDRACAALVALEYFMDSEPRLTSPQRQVTEETLSTLRIYLLDGE